MNKLSLIAVFAVIFGFFTEFISYLCGTQCAVTHDGTAMLWFCWSFISLIGGLASMAFGMFVLCAPLVKEATKDD